MTTPLFGSSAEPEWYSQGGEHYLQCLRAHSLGVEAPGIIEKRVSAHEGEVGEPPSTPDADK